MEHVLNYEFIGDLRMKHKLSLRTHDNNQGCLEDPWNFLMKPDVEN